MTKEVFITLVALTAILLLIFLSNQFVQYLNRAASGNIPAVIVMQLMMLELPNLLGLLLPLGFYVAILLAYGRLYAESEMTILRACGYGPYPLLQHTLIMATFVAGLVGVVVLWLSPYIAIERATLLRSVGIQTLIQTIMPGRFHAMDNNRQVFYVQSMNKERTEAQQILIVKQTPENNWDILWADKAVAEKDPKNLEDYLVLQQGKEYHGKPGQADFQVAQFAEYRARLPHPSVNVAEDVRTYKTADLWPLNNSNREKAAELQWRFAIPLMVFALTIVAVPLSRVHPRSGKYAHLLPALLIYLFYANGLFIARNALVSGNLPLWLGLWWLPVLVGLVGCFLFWRNQVKLG